MKISSQNKYTKMQKAFYQHVHDPIYGAKESHNKFYGYENLFKGIKTKNKLALDFGCGLGRSVELYTPIFKRVDGADIHAPYIEKCREMFPKSKFYVTNGVKLNGVPDSSYDVIFSTVTLQHIPVWKIRFSILEDFYRVLKPGGYISIQMGYGKNPSAVDYFADFFDAEKTNSGCDVRIEEPHFLEIDLMDIGFDGFKYTTSGPGPSDRHQGWIYFRAKK